MRVKRMNIRRWLFYPHILNPAILIAVLISVGYGLLFSWWEKRDDDEFVVYKALSKKRVSDELRDYIMDPIILIIVNTWWLNDKLSKQYVRYVNERYFSNWRQHEEVYHFNSTGSLGWNHEGEGYRRLRKEYTFEMQTVNWVRFTCMMCCLICLIVLLKMLKNILWHSNSA